MTYESPPDHGQKGSKEDKILPAKADLRQIAYNAILGGIFDIDIEAIKKNEGISQEYSMFPTNLIDIPYGNGPHAIQYGVDLPEDIVFAVRKNFVKANALLLPTDQVRLYFHQQFYEGRVFNSQSLARLVGGYFPSTRLNFLDDRNIDSNMSFRTDINRKVYDRNLYTRNEAVIGQNITLVHPELILTVLTYQSILQDYFQELRSEFEDIAQQTSTEITAENLKLYDIYAKQWTTGNFTSDLIPAMIIFYSQKMKSVPSTSASQMFDQELFREAVEFIISNGAFRNWIDVPEDIALDGKKRINHFLCPAVGVIREQLHDGFLLSKIYDIVQEKMSAGEEQILEYNESIQQSLLAKRV
jgi:hypothetical protein